MSEYRPDVGEANRVMKLWLLSTLCIATLVGGGELRAAEAQGGRTPARANGSVAVRRLYLLPIGDTPAFLIDTLLVQCRRKLNLPVDTLPRLGSDRAWVDTNRNQIVAERVIASLRQRYPREARNDDVVIGITSADMYIARYSWQFAFGYRPGGGFGQRVAVVSFARMRPEFYNEPRSDGLLVERLRKMVIRYIGVLYFQLPFNTDQKSVLYKDLLGLAELDTMGEELPLGPRRATPSPGGRRP